MACFPKKYIALLNTVQTTEEDNVELFTDSITVSQASGNQLSGADLWTDKSVYGNRSKVALTLPNLPADVKELTLSVVRKDYVLKGFPISADGQKNYTSVPERSFAAECEGHIVTILIVEFARDFRAQGNSIRDAAFQAGHIRLRPILMTSLAFVFGVMPLLFATGAGAGSRIALGAAVVFGMALNTLLATVYIPNFYELMQKLQEKFSKKQ